MDIDDDTNSELLLDTLLTITCLEPDNLPKMEVKLICKDGSLGRGGLYELLQYFKNKLTV